MSNDLSNRNEVFFDTSILVHAYDNSEPEKQVIAAKLVKKVFNAELKGYLSNQVLSELFFVLTGKKGVSKEDAEVIFLGFIEAVNWTKLNYNTETVKKAIKLSKTFPVLFWDIIIAETMRENGIFSIITSDEEDFRKIPGIEVINPFEK